MGGGGFLELGVDVGDQRFGIGLLAERLPDHARLLAPWREVRFGAGRMGDRRRDLRQPSEGLVVDPGVEPEDQIGVEGGDALVLEAVWLSTSGSASPSSSCAQGHVA